MGTKDFYIVFLAGTVVLVLLMLPLSVLSLSFLLLVLADGTVYEVLGAPLHHVQTGKVALGTNRPCEGAAVLYDGHHLGFAPP